ncbi:DUF2325 domain-containing protein [Polaromonas sp. LjRoot131]
MKAALHPLPGLDREHHALLAQYGEIQQRCSRVIAAQAAEIARLQAQAVRLRAAALLCDTALAWEREDRQAVEAAIPGLPKRLTLARRVEWLVGRVHDLQQALRERLIRPKAPALPSAEIPVPADLHEKSVLCVGEPGASASVARRVIEMAGGRFLHHGGEDGQDGPALEASLVAADLVICQTGCVSHDAYWRVQDHCRRTGKQCVLVEQPQALQFVRSREVLAPATEHVKADPASAL